MDGSGGALVHALCAQTALVGIDVCQVVLHRDGLVRADLGALAAAYAGRRASLAGNGALVLAAAENHHLEAAGAFGPELDDALGAGLGAGSAAGALALVNHRQPRFGVHRDGAELAHAGAVAATQTAIRAGGVAAVEGRLDLAGGVSLVVCGLGTVCARSVTFYHGHLGGLCCHRLAQNGGDLAHCLAASNGAEGVAQVVHGHQFRGEITTAGRAATAAIGAGESRLHIVDAGVLLHFELLGHDKKDCRNQQPDRSENDYSNNYRIHSVKVIVL